MSKDLGFPVFPAFEGTNDGGHQNYPVDAFLANRRAVDDLLVKYLCVPENLLPKS
jgi:hypothetical protein